ncbi:MAG TPA: endolytic transglycosylase MltG [Solirubrobacteraceae bacterium]|nr:endolytic transglycosylase MltG [Solirubrobacteraceae bacterium]
MSRGNRSEAAHERTAQERERDRLERERRRAEREGAALPPQAPPPQAPPPEVPSVQAPSAAQPSEPETAEHSPAQPPPQSPPPLAPEPPLPAAEPPPWSPVLDSSLLAEPEDRVEQGEPEDPAEHDPYEPLQPPSARRTEDPASAVRPPLPPPSATRDRAARGDPTGRRRPQRSGRSRFTRARVAALLALAAAAVLVWFLLSLFQPFAGEGSGRVIVQIPKGASSGKIGSILSQDDVVSSGFFFNLRALLEGKRSSLHSGRFVMKKGMSYSAAIDALSKPPPKVIAVKVVIPEGYTRRQIAALVGEDSLSGDYLAASKRSRLLSPRHYGAPKGTRDLEGFLFPATYDMRAGAPAQKLVNEQLIAFRRRFTSADTRRAHELGVTPYEMLTVASMIEREAQTEHDRPLIAAVIYNRLREGIPLGIDATIYYAVEEQKGIATYAGELTQSMLKIDSPYNTRTHKGLPPTPISNPGEASIHAAAHPAHVPYLYYVAGADGCGEQVFSKTYAEFEKNVAAYDAAVKKNGGHPPACKKK